MRWLRSLRLYRGKLILHVKESRCSLKIVTLLISSRKWKVRTTGNSSCLVSVNRLTKILSFWLRSNKLRRILSLKRCLFKACIAKNHLQLSWCILNFQKNKSVQTSFKKSLMKQRRYRICIFRSFRTYLAPTKTQTAATSAIAKALLTSLKLQTQMTL